MQRKVPKDTADAEDAGLLGHKEEKRDDKVIQPTKTVTNKLTQVTSFIIITEFCERIAFYGFQGSLVLFLTRELHMPAATADMHTVTWNGVAYVTPLLGGWLADAKLGRYNSILVFSAFYLAGLIGITVVSQKRFISAPVFFISLYIIALGTGGIKPNVSTFGADQFDDNNPVEEKQKEGFFNWFYLSINLGAFISFTVIAYVCQNISFAIGYLIPTVIMVAAIAIFMAGKPRYKISPPAGSNMTGFMKLIWQASQRPSMGETHFLDRARTCNGGSYSDKDVEDVKVLLSLMPFLFLFVLYWSVYSQMSTTWFNQGCQMDLRLPGGYMTPVAALSLFDTIVIVIMIPLLDTVIYPCFKRCGIEFSLLQKIGAGFATAGMAMLAAGFVEMARLNSFAEGNLAGPSICTHNNPPQAVGMSVLWQIPQFTLVGISEVLASVTALQFFYTQSPLEMRSVLAALNLFTGAIGTWCTALFILLGNAFSPESPWVADDANKGKLHYYFFMLAGFMFMNLFLFIWIARGYVYKEDRDAALLNDQAAASSTETSQQQPSVVVEN